MADTEGESLESWLNKATSLSNRQEDWEYIIGFCDQINKELEGPQISVRLLAHKIQSPQEWEAMQALTVLEACMKNCGRRFHNEVGKFRFLNELIKVVSPKYLGDRVSEGVKTKVVEIIYSWTISLPDEVKICEAYQMLKKQGVVTVDPDIPQDKTLMPSPPTRPKNPVFENEEKSKRLAELLKSKKPEDLQEANRLIKNMVKEDEVRIQRASRRCGTLEEVSNSVKLLNEMLSHFSRDASSDGDKELIRELYGDCAKLRQTVFKMATETEDNDSSLGDILQASDDLSRVINSYRKIVEGQTINGDMESLELTTSQRTKDDSQSEILIDLAGLDSPSLIGQQAPVPQRLAPSSPIPADLLYGSSSGLPPAEHYSPGNSSAALCLLNEDLVSLGLSDPAPALTGAIAEEPNSDIFNCQMPSLQAPNPVLDLFGDTPIPAAVFTMPPFSSSASTNSTSKTVSAATVTYPESSSVDSFPSASLVFTAAPLATPPASSLSSSLPLSSSAPPASFPQASVATSIPCPSGSLSASASLNHSSLQDLAMLDLGNTRSTTGPSGSDVLFGMGEAVGAAALSSSAGIPPSRSSPLPFGIAPPGGPSCLASVYTPQADDSPLLRSLSPTPPLGVASPSKALEVSLASPSKAPEVSLASPSKAPEVFLASPFKAPEVSLASPSKSPEVFLASPFKASEVSLASVHVPLDAIRPSKACPVTAYDKNGIRVLLHFASDCPPGRPDVLVMVVSMLNTAPLAVRNMVLQAAVPKTMRVRLQPPSATELAPFSPIVPPAAITQVMLLANPLQEKVRMRYKLTFMLGEQQCTETGEVDQFPPTERWGAL